VAYHSIYGMIQETRRHLVAVKEAGF
jgi:hypothetical protein